MGQATITGATTLLRYGNETERGVGGSVIAASTIPAAATMYLLLTSAFKAVWNGKEWENLEEDFVEKNGFLFEDYRGTRQGYNGVEYLMMLASGVLAAFPNEQCASTAQVAVGINAAYILVMACARPYESKVDGVYFFAISVAQLGSSMCHMYALIKDNDSYQNGAEITAASLGYVMGARTVYDVVVLVKALKKRCSGEGEEGKDQTDLAVPMLLVVPTVVPGPPSSGSNPLGR